MTGRQETTTDETAVAWFVLLRDEAADEDDRARFAAWLAADPEHHRAWQSVAALWGGLEGLRGDVEVTTAPRPSRRRRSDMAASVRHALAAGLALLLILAGAAGLWVTQPPGFFAGLLADVRTAPGERRLVTLPDRSTVTLDAASSLSIAYGGMERRVVLHGGQAYFHVRKDPAHPFVVEAGDGRVTVVGTAFDVKLHAEATDVTVASGVVRVTDAAGAAVRLGRGQGLRYSPHGVSEPYAVTIDDIAAWREDRLIFEAAPLGEVLRDLERYRPGRILVTDDAVAALPVTGVFDIGKPDAALETIARSLPVRLRYLTDLLVLVSPLG